MFVHIILSSVGCSVATFWERAAHSVDHMFSLYFDYFSHFGFEVGIWVLIAPVPGLCILVTFTVKKCYCN